MIIHFGNRAFHRPDRCFFRVALAASASTCALCLASVTQAQEQPRAPASRSSDDAAEQRGLEEIVVTAQRREQRLQDVPVAVTALTPEAIEANQIQSFRDLGGTVPNLTTRSGIGGSNAPFYTIRGEHSNTVALGAERGVAYYIDDVYIAATNGGGADFATVEQIEVLRGPQGTLFGRNATGGAVSIRTPEPADEFGGRGTISYGNYDQLRTTTTLNSGKFGDFSAKVSYVHSDRRGDIKNLRPGVVWDFSPAFGRPKTFTSTKYLGSTNSEGVQAAAKFESGDFKAVYRFDWYQSDFVQDGTGMTFANTLVRNILATQDPATVTPIQLSRPDAVNNGNAVPSDLEGYGHTLVAQYRVSDAISLKNIVAYRKSEYAANWTDISGAGVIINNGAPIFASALGPALASTTVGAPFLVQATATSGTDRQFSEEFQVNYNSGFLTATVGGIYFENRQTRAGIGVDTALGRARSGAFRVYPNFAVPFAGQPAGGGGRLSRVTTQSYAVFGQGEFHITPKIDAIVGARYTKDQRSGTDRTVTSNANPVVFPLDYESSKITYNVGLNFKPNDDILLYGKFSTGYIAGGSIGGLPYGSQTAKSLEGGIKADLLDRLLRVNLAVFAVKYDNVQFSGNGGALTPPRPELTNFLVSAGAAKAHGFEIETQLAPARGLSFSGGLGYTDFKFTRLEPVVTAGTAYYEPINRPKWTVNLSGQYETEPLFDDVRMTFRADGNYRSSQHLVAGIPVLSASFTQAQQDAFREASVSKGYWIVNSRVSFDGLNIGGADASLAFWVRNLFDEDKPTTMQSLVTVISAQYERARTYGIELAVNF